MLTKQIYPAETQSQILFLVEYSSVEYFFNMISNPKDQKIATNRSISLEHIGLITCETAQ